MKILKNTMSVAIVTHADFKYTVIKCCKKHKIREKYPPIFWQCLNEDLNLCFSPKKNSISRHCLGRPSP